MKVTIMTASMLTVMGRHSGIAYEQSMDDFSRVSQCPIAVTNLDVGHAGTYAQHNGRNYTSVALA